MIKFKVHYGFVIAFFILFLFGGVVEFMLYTSSPSKYLIVRNTPGIITIQEVRNHGWNVSEPLLFYKVPEGCRSAERHGCYRLVDSQGFTYNYNTYFFEWLQTQRTRFYNLEQIERIRNNEQARR
jgi:hypothetical protein